MSNNIDKAKMVEHLDKRLNVIPADWYTAIEEIKTMRRKINSGEFDCEEKNILKKCECGGNLYYGKCDSGICDNFKIKLDKHGN